MPRRPVRPAGKGEKNNDPVRIRNPVRQNGRVVRRMIVRRQTIYSST